MSIRRSFSANLLGTVLPLTLSLLTVPLYLKLLGAERYGVIAIAWLLLGYFNIFDLGLGRATAQKIAAIGDGPDAPDRRRKTFWTALWLNLGFGLVGALAFWPLGHYYFSSQFSAAAGLRAEVLTAVPWLALAVPLSTVSGVLVGALQGREKFLAINTINVATGVVAQLVPLAIVWRAGPSLGLLLPVMMACRTSLLVPLLVVCRRAVCGPGRPVFARSMVRELLGFGGWVTVSSFVSPLMVILDRFVIGQTLGPRWVAYYSVPFQLAERTTVLSWALAGAIFPRLASATPEEARRLSAGAVATLAALLTLPIMLGIFFLDPFLRFWVGPDIAEHASQPGQILLIAFWFNCLAAIPHDYLQATARPALLARSHLLELLPYLGLLYLGLHFAGITGAALAFGARVSADFLLLSYFSRLLGALRSRLVVPLSLLLLALGATAFLPATGRNIAGALLLIVCLAWQWKNQPADVRSRLLSLAGAAFPQRPK